MRETSIGLGSIQFLFTALLVCVLVYLALGVGVIALACWAIFHLATTRSAAVVVRAGSVAAGGVDAQERVKEVTNIPALIAAGLGAVAGVTFLVGLTSWLGVALSVLAALAAAYALVASTGASRATSFAMKGTLVMGAVLALIALTNTWTNAPITLYGDPAGEQQGTFTTIAEFQAELPCIDEPRVPAAGEQKLFKMEISSFVATASCSISDDKDARDVIFVQASSADDLERIFASGVIEAGKLHDNQIWVERDGAIAVVTSDEASGDLAQDAGTTWISLRDEKPRRSQD
ncbi:hypothetical protein [Herbiconiux solani]|uniref:hypothetical protein n=1 Tax=Herbiconiux solani TaxID=661329 RepID=UPI0012EE9B42|nr:hypothetical protein [Herbiconiux solani]